MQKILILAALPEGLRLDKEIREVRAAIERAKGRHLFKIEYRTAVQPQDIRRAIAEERPSIVHFCGHGLEDGSLLLEDEVGNHNPVSPRGLVSLFRLHAKRVKCVLLNACYSSLAAEAISQHVNYVIGMNQPIQDRAAIVFAQGFYDGLGYDDIDKLDVIQRAFDEGIVAIELENLLQGTIPSMWKLGIAQRKIESTNQNSDESSNLRDYTRLQKTDDDLSSERNVDYTQLRNLLSSGNWKDADYETYSIVFKVVGCEEGDWISDKELLNFPCTDLRTIDRLWVKYSSGHFGFSVQKEIYLEVGGILDGEYHEEAWEKFGDHVGWKVNQTWILDDDVTFNTTAPVGHLPWCFVSARGVVGLGLGVCSSLVSRLVNCNI